MRKIWDKIVAWMQRIPSDKKYHFVAGFVIAAFFAISLHMAACVVPALFAGFIKEFFDNWTGGELDWKDWTATAIGGAVCQVFVGLGVWWGFYCIA